MTSSPAPRREDSLRWDVGYTVPTEATFPVAGTLVCALLVGTFPRESVVSPDQLWSSPREAHGPSHRPAFEFASLLFEECSRRTRIGVLRGRTDTGTRRRRDRYPLVRHTGHVLVVLASDCTSTRMPYSSAAYNRRSMNARRPRTGESLHSLPAHQCVEGTSVDRRRTPSRHRRCRTVPLGPGLVPPVRGRAAVSVSDTVAEFGCYCIAPHGASTVIGQFRRSSRGSDQTGRGPRRSTAGRSSWYRR